MSRTEEKHIFLCDLTHVGQKIASDSFPLGIGCIATYLEANSEIPLVTHLYKFPDEVFDAFVKYQPRIVGFSNYVWNLDLSLNMAKIIKEEYPKTVIVFGGPNFPRERDEQEEFLRSNEVIDFYIEGEGEKSFQLLVRNLCTFDYNLDKLKPLSNPSVRTIYEDNFVTNELATRINNLDEVPSPYLTGKMDKFFTEKLMPLIQTTRGCPFSCTYCVEGHGYYNQVVTRNSRDYINVELEYIAKKVTDNKQLFIADSNFGMYNEDVQTAKAIRQMMDEWGFPSYIQVATGKNRKDLVLEIARILKGKLRLSGSVQSLDPVVLSNVKRKNILTEQLLDVASDSKEIGANSYSEVILGLPGDSLDAHMETMKGVIEAGFDFVLPWTLMLLQGSEMSGRETKKKFGMTLKYRVLPRCFGIYHFGDREFVSAEIEEVCIGNDNLSFDDYVECRRFTLTTALFYNDRLFGEIQDLLKSLKLSPFSWLSIIHNTRDSFPDNLKSIYENFENDTINELWNSEEDLHRFLNNSETIRKYISGELGINVMYHYRTKAIINGMKELNNIAFDAAESLVNKDQPEYYQINGEFLSQLRLFSLARKIDMLDFEKSFEYDFSYDFKHILEQGLFNLSNAKQGGKMFRYRFYHSIEQTKAIKEQMGMFGSDIVGLAKVLSRIKIKDLYRQIGPVSL